MRYERILVGYSWGISIYILTSMGYINGINAIFLLMGYINLVGYINGININ